MRISLLMFALAATAAHGQWEIQKSGTTASLRGIDNVGGGIAWASGTNGTVLKTVDAGKKWQVCPVPPNADKLDFRGVQAFDAKTAIVMSSGKGDLSRLYKTADGCATWKLVLINPDKEGFWDAIKFRSPERGFLLGDPVGGKLKIEETYDGGASWAHYWGDLPALPNEGAFAASNSALALGASRGEPAKGIDFIFGMGGSRPTRAMWMQSAAGGDVIMANWAVAIVPIAGNVPSAGIFSIAVSDGSHIVAVGGDYLKPSVAEGTAAATSDQGRSWSAATTPARLSFRRRL
jgi:hypothetical protein